MSFNILVIGGKASFDWKELFANETVGDQKIRIERAHWDEIVLVSYHDSGLIVDLYPKQSSNNTTTKEPVIGYHPHFIVFRSAARGIYGQDFRNVLYGIMHSNITCINSIQSIYLCQEKPIIYGKLNNLVKKVGRENFPLIPQTYYASWRGMSFHCELPLVVKFGTCHSGFGKMRIMNDSDFEDIRSIAALQPSYVTAEPFIDWDYDIRIQKIGHHYRAFKRTSSNWKGKSSSQEDIDIEVTDRYKFWVDQACLEFGMDVCAIDAVHSKIDNMEYILELNDSAIGFNIRHEEEDFQHLKELILLRIFQSIDTPPPHPQSVSLNIISDNTNDPIDSNNTDSNDEKKPRDEFDSLPLEEQIIILKNKLNKLETTEKEAADSKVATPKNKSESKSILTFFSNKKRDN